MKKTNKIILISLSFIFSIGAVISSSLSMNLGSELWRINTLGNVENISDVCTVTPHPVLCQVVFPSNTVNGYYSTDPFFVIKVSPAVVYYIP